MPHVANHPGKNGFQSVIDLSLNNIDVNTIWFEDGTSLTTAPTNGVTGATGSTGPAGPKNLWDTFNITVSGGKYYVDGVERDTIYLYRNYRYEFTLDDSVSSHPFVIQTSELPVGDEDRYYNDGITPNLPLSGPNSFEFDVPNNAPDNLYYRCERHSNMGGNIIISDFHPDDLRGPTGETGARGPTGRDGNFGGASFDYTFNTNVSSPNTDGTIAPGTVRYIVLSNNLASSIQISPFDDEGKSVRSFVNSIDAVQNSVKAIIRIVVKNDSTRFQQFTISKVTSVRADINPPGNYVFEVENIAASENGVLPFTGEGNQDVILSFALVGNRGSDGGPGPRGPTGETGPKGNPGGPGPRGPTGETGPKGDPGNPGPRGPTGETGPKGDPGNPGPRGPTGRDGNFGGASFDYTHTGVFESSGPTNQLAAGKVTYVGNSGVVYGIQVSTLDDEGVDIVNFVTAIKNVQNEIKAILRVVVKNDSTRFQQYTISNVSLYQGNPASWIFTVSMVAASDSGVIPFQGDDNKDVILSFALVGNQGSAGGPGPRGPTGETGPKGDPGNPGGPGPRGPTGETGPKGDPGSPGGPGPRGPTGETGPKGDPGNPGGPGPRGPTGETGPKGDPGNPGGPGPRGPTGETGPKGDPGNPGGPGPRGPTGETGPKGDPGNPGGPGSRGPTGPTGQDGRDGRDGILVNNSIIATDNHISLTAPLGYTPTTYEANFEDSSNTYGINKANYLPGSNGLSNSIPEKVNSFAYVETQLDMTNYGGTATQKVYFPVYFKRTISDPPPTPTLIINPLTLQFNGSGVYTANLTASAAPASNSSITYSLSQTIRNLEGLTVTPASGSANLTTVNWNTGIPYTVRYIAPGLEQITPLLITGTITFAVEGYINAQLTVNITSIRRDDPPPGDGDNGGGQINENLNIQ